MNDDSDEWHYGLLGVVLIPNVEEAYPKPAVLSAKEEQDRVWNLLVQAAKN